MEDSSKLFWKSVISYRAAICYLKEDLGVSMSRAKLYVHASRYDGVWRILVDRQVFFNRKAFMSYVERVKRSLELEEYHKEAAR